MESMAAAHDPSFRAPRLALLREPLSWAALAAFVGSAVGLLGAFRQAGLEVSQDFTVSAILFSTMTQALGQVLVALSLIGIPSLLGDGPTKAGRGTSVSGGILVLFLVLTSAASVFFLFYMNSGERLGDTSQSPPPLYEVSFWASVALPSVVALPYAVAAFLGREMRLGALLAGLCVLNLPFLPIRFLLFPPDPDAYLEPSAAPALLGGYGWGVSLLEAPLWFLLGVLLLRAARERSYGEAVRLEAEENLKRARRLYEEGLARNDPSAVDGLVSRDFRDLRRGARGKLAMERFFADLWASYPDLAVSVKEQEAEGDLVRTRLMISGTDRGSGVMWQAPTGRRVSFEAKFVDRFRGGELVEHAGEADTEELLRQLGHHREGRPGSGPNF